MSTALGSEATAGPGGPEAALRRRRWPRVLAWTLSVLLVLVVGVVFGVAWYFSGIALAVDRTGGLASSVRAGADAAGEPDGTILLTGSPLDSTDGLHGVRWEGGWGVTGEVLSVETDGTVVREWLDREGTLPVAAVEGRIDQDVFLGDPGVVGMAFDEVTVTSDVGDLPTYRVPAPSDPTGEQAAAAGTWIVFAHGRGGQREEANRYLPLWHQLGYEVLVPSYRNDTDAPQAPDGRYGLGETEWRDVDAAVAYALDNGADDVVLAGWSMGGAINMQVLDRSEHAGSISGLVLDAPVLDWRDTLRHQGSAAGLPQWWSDLAVDLVALRAGMDMADYDWAARAEEVTVPVYLVHSDGDTFVPNEPSRAFAEARPDNTTARFDGPAEHTREWNVAPETYDAQMREWFTTVLR